MEPTQFENLNNATSASEVERQQEEQLKSKYPMGALKGSSILQKRMQGKVRKIY